MSRFVLAALVLNSALAFGQKEYGFDNMKSSGQPYLRPDETLARMKVADGFEVKLFAAEPMVVNPIAFTVDERGRVWVVECFEYPSRTPPGKMPRDRIVILEDTDGDGVADKRTVFAEGKDFPERFDLASGIEVGHGGVFLGAPPNLWFIEDKGDKPGEFTKLLGGFGSQDTHETLNTFQWGSDGWLYGLHGIFTQSKVTASGGQSPPVELNAGLWRYEPRAKRFEVVAEGTSNPWGWDYRNTDGQVIAACCVIPHLFHLVPGGSYKRQSGQGFNPYAYGHIAEICDHTFHKESGWAHAGLLSLDTPIVPAEYRNSVIFGSIHGCSIKRNSLKPNGSTYTASRADDFLVSGDKNVRPLNLRWGPNGEILLIDWHDRNPCHQAEAGSWDYERGRIYRIIPKGRMTKRAFDYGALTPSELVRRLGDPNPYVVRTVLRLLDERRGQLSIQVKDALSAARRPLWLQRCELFGESEAINALDAAFESALTPSEKSANLRCEALRAIGNWNELPPRVLAAVLERAKVERSPAVRRELASLAIRHAKSTGAVGLTHALLRRTEDANDSAIPQLLWTAYEPRLAAEPKVELDWLSENIAGNALLSDTIASRAVRRVVARGRSEDLSLAIEFLGRLTDSRARQRGLQGLIDALKGRVVDPPANWLDVRERLAADPQTAKLLATLAPHFRDRRAIAEALATVNDPARVADWLTAVRVLAVARPPEGFAPLMAMVRKDATEEVRGEACRALAGYERPEVTTLLAGWSSYSPAIKSQVVELLAGRKEWAKELIAAVASGRVERMAVGANVALRMRAFKDTALDAALEAGWGKFRDTPAELSKLIETMRRELDKAPASFTKGRAVFEANCGKCHQFDGRGYNVGPALDGAGRDLDYILVNVLDPNRAVGAPYFLRQVLLKNGRLEQGLLHAEDPQTITLKGENDALNVIAKADTESIEVLERSVMPEGLAYNMTTQDFRDLVRYLMASPPVADWRVSAVLEKPTDSPPAGKRVQLGASGKLEVRPETKTGYAYATSLFSSADAFATKLHLGSNSALRVWLDGKQVYAGKPGDGSRPDQSSADVMLTKGDHTLVVEMNVAASPAVLFARFDDANRKLRFADP